LSINMIVIGSSPVFAHALFNRLGFFAGATAGFAGRGACFSISGVMFSASILSDPDLSTVEVPVILAKASARKRVPMRSKCMPHEKCSSVKSKGKWLRKERNKVGGCPKEISDFALERPWPKPASKRMPKRSIVVGPLDDDLFCSSTLFVQALFARKVRLGTRT
jgi:hypothetical protein